MKRTFFFVIPVALVYLFFSAMPLAARQLAWEETTHWSIKDAKPLDVATSYEKNMAFVLANDGIVRVFSRDGALLGKINVGKKATAIAISVRGDLLYVTEATTGKVRIISVDFMADFNLEGAPFLGAANAPIVIVEFSDFQCPYCAKMPSLMEQVLEQNPGMVKVVYKQYPLPMHKFAPAAAQASIAAHMQGKFWQMHDLLFANQKKLSMAKIIDLAKQVGLDMKRFRKDFDSEAVKKTLMRDLMEGRKAGVSGTPSLFVNGRKVRKNNLPSLQKRIDEAKTQLAGSNKR